MRIGTTPNNQPAFGSFNVVLPAKPEERQAFKALYQGIKRVLPETTIKYDHAKREIGFLSKILYQVFNITGKNEAAEQTMMKVFSGAKFPVSERIETPMERVKKGIMAMLANPVIESQKVRLDKAA